MNFPGRDDYIDIHTHEARPCAGVFSVENIMAHENRIPEQTDGLAFTFGIHPWYLSEANKDNLIAEVAKSALLPSVIAIGEAGFDRMKGPSQELQRWTFERQIFIAEENRKPVVVHCVRAWDELLRVHKRMNPGMPWLVHGFRGNKDLASQLISKGMYLSFWFDFILKPESSELLRNLPKDRIFLETDGAEVDIRDIYNKVSGDLALAAGELKTNIYSNFNKFFNINP